MMSVVETKKRRAQLGGRRSHLAEQIAVMYFNTNTNAKKSPLGTCFNCMQGDSSTDEETGPLLTKVTDMLNKLKDAENQAKAFNQNTTKLRKTESIEKPNIFKAFLQKRKEKNNKKVFIKARRFNEKIGGELVVINISSFLYPPKTAEEKKIRLRSYLTPQNYELTRQYYSGIQDTSHLVLEAADKLGLLLESGEVEGDLDDWRKCVKEKEEEKRKLKEFNCLRCLKELKKNVKESIIQFICETCICYDEESMLLIS